MADPFDFNDIFWETLSEEENATLFSSSSGVAELSVTGKGTIAVRSKATQELTFVVSAGEGYPKLTLKITQKSCVFEKEDKKEEKIETTTWIIENMRPEASPYLPETAKADGTVYWLSIDRSNYALRYGKYYTCKALTMLMVPLTEKDVEWLEKLTTVEVKDEISPLKVKISRLPVTEDLPPLVITNESVSLRDLDLVKVTTWANLPKACQNLYHNIVGQGVTLEPNDFPDLADAIHKSVTTPGYWGYKKLQSKCKKPEDFEMKYLRVTIGSSKGNSPGIPYVMEVWPPGHRSVIHDHGDACAVIRVLSGSIQCTWYDSLDSEKEPVQLGNPCLLRKGQVTWLGENQYQVHSLQNIRDRTCVTLQCYEFGEENKTHVEKFRFIEKGKEKENFTPNSDCTFAEFYDYMEWEWKYQRPYGT